MRRILKIIFILVLIALVVLGLSRCNFLPFLSLSVTKEQDGIEVTLEFNKQEYNKDEEIEITLNIKNNNSYEVKNIKTEIILPNEVKLVKGSLISDSFYLKANENRLQEIILKKNDIINNNDIEVKNIDTTLKYFTTSAIVKYADSDIEIKVNVFYDI